MCKRCINISATRKTLLSLKTEMTSIIVLQLKSYISRIDFDLEKVFNLTSKCEDLAE